MERIRLTRAFRSAAVLGLDGLPEGPDFATSDIIPDLLAPESGHRIDPRGPARG